MNAIVLLPYSGSSKSREKITIVVTVNETTSADKSTPECSSGIANV